MSPLLVRMLEWTSSPTAPLDVVDRGSGCISIFQKSADSAEFHLCICNESFRTELLIDSSTAVRREGDCTIVFSATNSVSEHAFVFADPTSASIVWIAVCVLVSGQAETLVAVPTLDNIALLQKYLSSVHSVFHAMIARSVARSGFLSSLYEAFAAAEVQQRFDLMPLFRKVTLSLVLLNSRPVLALLLSPNNIDRTIACLEYDPSLGASSFQTTHRCFLDQTKLHCVLPSLHERFQSYAYANYRIGYLKNAVLCHNVTEAVVATLDSIIADNSCAIAEVLLSDPTFAKTLTGCIVPVIVTLDGDLVLSSEPNRSALRFLVELFALPIPQSAMRRLVRKLCDNRLLELLVQSYTASADATTVAATLDVFAVLLNVASARVVEHVLNPQCELLNSIIQRLTDDSECSVACDRSLEFLQSLITPFDAVDASAECNDRVSELVGTLLSSFIRHLSLRTPIASGNTVQKQRKVCDFVGCMIKVRPELCRSRFGGCVSWFMSLADRVLIDLDLSAQQRHLCLSSVRLLSTSACVSDDYFVCSLLSRTGMSESLFLMLLANGGSDNMLGSAVQGMVCKMAEQWLTSMIDGRAAKLIERLPARALSNSLGQLMMALSAAANNVCANRIAQPPAAPSLQRQNSLDVYCNQKDQSHLNQPGVVGSIFSRPADVVSPPMNHTACQHEVTDSKKLHLAEQRQRLNDQCDNSLTAAHLKLQSDHEAMKLEFRDFRCRSAAQRLASLTSQFVRRQQSAVLCRWKSVVAHSIAAVSLAEPSKDSDPFLMDALYVLAWQRKVDRERAMALTLRLSLLPLLKRRHQRVALFVWRQAIQHQKATEAAEVAAVVQESVECPETVTLVVDDSPCTSPSALPDLSQWRSVFRQTPSSLSLISEDSCSSVGATSDSTWMLAHQNSFSPLVSNASSPHSSMSSRSSCSSLCSSLASTPSMSHISVRDLVGEDIGAPDLLRGIKRTDSDMFYMVRNLKNGDPFLGITECKRDSTSFRLQKPVQASLQGPRAPF